MTEGQLVVDICTRWNQNPPEITLHDAFDDMEVDVAIMDGNFTVDALLEKYQDQIRPHVFKELRTLLCEKMKAAILDRVKEMRGTGN
jgi:hypothetical protein